MLLSSQHSYFASLPCMSIQQQIDALHSVSSWLMLLPYTLVLVAVDGILANFTARQCISATCHLAVLTALLLGDVSWTYELAF